MVPVGGKPFLEHQLNLLKSSGLRDVVLCVGNLAEQIEEYFGDGRKFDVRIQYVNDEKCPMGTGGALRLAEPLLDDAFLTLYGDSYLPFNFSEAVEFFRRFQKMGMMVVYRNQNRIEPSNVEVEDELVKIYNKEQRTAKMDCIDYGVSVFRKDSLRILPKNEACDMFDLHSHLISQKDLLAFEVKERFYQIGSFEGLEEFRSYAREHNL
jgi:NDP-sugar pyrophosphorylase family protein